MPRDDERPTADPASSDPKTKLLLTYDPLPDHREAYFEFVLGQFVPAMERLGLRMSEAWYTAYGDYPLRLTGFVALDEDTLLRALDSDVFAALEARLLDHVINYRRRIVPARHRFQF
jgi:hypothetical protein